MGYKPKITFWYTEDKELDYLLQLRDFREPNLIRRYMNESTVDYDHYTVLAFKSKKTPMSQRGLKCSKIIMTKSFCDNISIDYMYDLFYPMLVWGFVGSNHIEGIEFSTDEEDDNIWGVDLFNVKDYMKEKIND